MRLFELDNSGELVTKIVTLTDQLRNDIDNGKISSNFTMEMLQNYFRQYGIILDKQDFYKMILKYPLKNVISNIEGEQVIFKGLPQQPKPTESPDNEKSQDIVSKMAHKAAGK